jgi:DNA replication factor GINS
MNLDELQSVRDRERQTDQLQQLRESFYADAGEFIEQLREERERVAERADDPYGAPEVNQLTTEIQTAEQTVEAIYEKRIGKIVKAASFDAAGLPSEAEGMTAEEQELFQTLVHDIEQNRERVMGVLDGSPQTEADRDGSAAERTNDDSADEPSVSAAELMGTNPGQETSEESSGDEPGDPPMEPPPRDTGEPTERDDSDVQPPPPPMADELADESNATSDGKGDGKSSNGDDDPEVPPDQPVREDGGQGGTAVSDEDSAIEPKGENTATETSPSAGEDDETDADDVPRETVIVEEQVETFLGVDEREYDLQAGDVVTLPSTNADLLLDQGVVRPLEDSVASEN